MQEEYLKGKRIVHITTVHPVFDNRIFFKECASLAQLGLDITLIAFCEKDFEKDGVKVKAIDVAKPSRMSKIRRAYHLALDLDADVYHLHDPELLLIKPFLRSKGKIVVYDMHEHFSQQILIKPWIPSWLRKPLSAVFSIYERLLLGKGPVVFAEDDYREHYKYITNYRIALNFPDLSKFRKLETESKYSDFVCIGYLGGVTEARGCLKTLKALVDIKAKTNKKIGYVCIGKFQSESFKQQLEILGQELDFYFAPGFMEFDEAIKYLAKCQIGMALLDRTPNYVNSYPTKIFEYMALGLPFIVSDFEINRVIVEENKCGIAIAPENHEELESALINLICDEELRNSLSFYGKKNSVKYDWSNQCKNITQGYKEWL